MRGSVGWNFAVRVAFNHSESKHSAFVHASGRGDGVLQLLQLGEVPRRAAELHRRAGAVHPRAQEAGGAHDDLLQLLPGGQRDPRPTTHAILRLLKEGECIRPF